MSIEKIKVVDIDLRDIPFSILLEEQIEDFASFINIIDEAAAVQALEFFDIDYNSDDDTLTVPEDFDYKEALSVVSNYFDSLDKVEPILSERAKAYDEHTKPHRGADDGTYDYAGTYVLSILDIIKAVARTKTNVFQSL
jgi:hypothetical protein